MLKTKDIIKYRESAKKIGIWDKDYASIRRDLNNALQLIRTKDYAMDIIGGSLDQMVLMARLAMYGEANNELSEEDLKALFSPLESCEDLDVTPYMLTNGAQSVIDDIFPLLFGEMEICDTYDEFESRMRGHMALPSNLSTFALSYGIAIGVCLRKYKGMSVNIERLNKKLIKILASSDRSDDLMDTIRKQTDQNTIGGKTFLFSAMFSAAVVECNLGQSVSLDTLYELIKDIEDVAATDVDMRKFYRSREFKLFVHCVEEFHEISR